MWIVRPTQAGVQKRIAAGGLSTLGRLFSRGALKRNSVEHARYERSPFVQSPLITGSPPFPKDLFSRRKPCTRIAAELLPAGRRPRHSARDEKDAHHRSSRSLPGFGEVETPGHRLHPAMTPLSPGRAEVSSGFAVPEIGHSSAEAGTDSHVGRRRVAGVSGGAHDAVGPFNAIDSRQGSKSLKAPLAACSSRYF